MERSNNFNIWRLAFLFSILVYTIMACNKLVEPNKRLSAKLSFDDNFEELLLENEGHQEKEGKRGIRSRSNYDYEPLNGKSYPEYKKKRLFYYYILYQIIYCYTKISYSYVDFNFHILTDEYMDSYDDDDVYTFEGDIHQISPKTMDSKSGSVPKIPPEVEKNKQKNLGTWNVERTCDGSSLVRGFKVSVSKITILIKNRSVFFLFFISTF